MGARSRLRAKHLEGEVGEGRAILLGLIEEFQLEVLAEVLGYDDARIASLRDAGSLG